MAVKESTVMVWRPNQLQISGLRATNAASYFYSKVLEDAPSLVLAVASVLSSS